MITLTGSVGFTATNARNDVIAIQEALNRVPASQGGPGTPLGTDGIAGANTKRAIVHFQQHHFNWADGRISSRGPTLAALNRALTPTAPAPAVPPISHAEIRGELMAPIYEGHRRTGGAMGRVSLGNGECWIVHGAGRTRIEAGHGSPVFAGDRIVTQAGHCKLYFLDGTHVSVRPNTLMVIHGAAAHARPEGSPAVLRSGSTPDRLRALSGG